MKSVKDQNQLATKRQAWKARSQREILLNQYITLLDPQMITEYK